eukprot:Opistho-2@30099
MEKMASPHKQSALSLSFSIVRSNRCKLQYTNEDTATAGVECGKRAKLSISREISVIIASSLVVKELRRKFLVERLLGLDDGRLEELFPVVECADLLPSESGLCLPRELGKQKHKEAEPEQRKQCLKSMRRRHSVVLQIIHNGVNAEQMSSHIITHVTHDAVLCNGEQPPSDNEERSPKRKRVQDDAAECGPDVVTARLCVIHQALLNTARQLLAVCLEVLERLLHVVFHFLVDQLAEILDLVCHSLLLGRIGRGEIDSGEIKRPVLETRAQILCDLNQHFLAVGFVGDRVGLAEIESHLIAPLFVVDLLHNVHGACAECLSHGIKEDADEIRLRRQPEDAPVHVKGIDHRSVNKSWRVDEGDHGEHFLL